MIDLAATADAADDVFIDSHPGQSPTGQPLRRLTPSAA
jgi:hypothetical protein